MKLHRWGVVFAMLVVLCATACKSQNKPVIFDANTQHELLEINGQEQKLRDQAAMIDGQVNALRQQYAALEKEKTDKENAALRKMGLNPDKYNVDPITLVGTLKADAPKPGAPPPVAPPPAKK